MESKAGMAAKLKSIPTASSEVTLHQHYLQILNPAKRNSERRELEISTCRMEVVRMRIIANRSKRSARAQQGRDRAGSRTGQMSGCEYINFVNVLDRELIERTPRRSVFGPAEETSLLNFFARFRRLCLGGRSGDHRSQTLFETFLHHRDELLAGVRSHAQDPFSEGINNAGRRACLLKV